MMNPNVQDLPDAVNSPGDQRSEPPSESPLGDGQALLVAMRKITGLDDLEFDADGDISLRRGSQLVYVRLPENAQLVRIWSPLLRGVEESPTLVARLNRLNMGTGSVRFCVCGGVIFAEAVIDAKPLLFQHLENSLRRFSDATDDVDVLLQAEFGGFTAETGPVPSVQLH